MRKIFALLILFTALSGKGIAGFNKPTTGPCDSTPANCDLDLRNPIFIANDILVLEGGSVIVYGNSSMSSDYHDVSFAEDNDDDCSHTTFCGGYSDCSNGGGVEYFCTQMARRGWVVFSIEYRRGNKKDPDESDGEFTSVFQMQAAYRAPQDLRGAIRYIIYRQQHPATHYDPYQLDTSNIFLGGESAGAVAMLTASYGYEILSQDIIKGMFPTRGSNQVYDVMGNINVDFYKGDTSYDYMEHVAGIVSLWGGVFVPHEYNSDPASFFSDLPYKPPVILFHGLADLTIPPGAKWLKFSPGTISHSAYNETNFCTVSGNYKLENDDSTSHDLRSLGSKSFYEDVLRHASLDVPAEIYLDCDTGHGFEYTCTDCFGTNYSDDNDVSSYMVQRTAVFFQSIINNNLGARTKTLFKQCENFRHSCATSDDYDSCPSNPCN